MRHTARSPAGLDLTVVRRLVALVRDRFFSTPARRGTIWSLGGYGGAQAIRLASNILLTRLLFEEAFGLMALVSVFLTGLQLFSDVGIGPSIIQNERGDDRDFVDTAWTIQVGRGVVLWSCSILGSIPFASFYGEPQLAEIIPVAGFIAFVSGFNSTKLFTANRHLAMGRLMIIEITSQVLGAAVMIGWALVDRSVWALAMGGVASSVVTLLLSHSFLPGERNRFRWSNDAAQRLIRFGRWIFLSTVMTFLVSHSDRLIFGKMIPMDMLGVYSIGVTLASLPTSALSHLVGRILFPSFSQVVRAGEPLEDAFHRKRLPVVVLGGWACAGLIAGGQVIIDILYDARYADAGWVVQVSAMAGWFMILESIAGTALFAVARPQWVAAASGGKLFGMLVLVPIGHSLGGFPGAVAGYAASEIFRYAVATFAIAQSGLSALPTDFKLSLWVAASACLGYATALAIEEPLGSIVAAIGVFVVVTGLWAPVGVSVWRQHRGSTATPAPST